MDASPLDLASLEIMQGVGQNVATKIPSEVYPIDLRGNEIPPNGFFC
jgi:hypothetical protein